MAWIQDTTMQTEFLSYLKPAVRDNCVIALRSCVSCQSASWFVGNLALQGYLQSLGESLGGCLENILRTHCDDEIFWNAASACAIVANAINVCYLIGLQWLLGDLKSLRIQVNNTFILTSCLKHSPLAEGKKMVEKWSPYFAQDLMGDLDFTSALVNANSKQFKEAIKLSENYKEKKERPRRERPRLWAVEGRRVDEESSPETVETEINGMPNIVRAVMDAVFDGDAESDVAGITTTGMADSREYPIDSANTDMSLYGHCQFCGETAFGQVDEGRFFYCEQCWRRYGDSNCSVDAEHTL